MVFCSKKSPEKWGLISKLDIIDMKKVGRPKGLPKTGGRKKGTPNAVTTDLRTFYKMLLDDNRGEIIKRLKRLDDKDFFQALDRFNRYVLPQLQSIDANVMFAEKLEQLTEAQLNLLIDQILNSTEHEQE